MSVLLATTRIISFVLWWTLISALPSAWAIWSGNFNLVFNQFCISLKKQKKNVLTYLNIEDWPLIFRRFVACFTSNFLWVQRFSGLLSPTVPVCLQLTLNGLHRSHRWHSDAHSCHLTYKISRITTRVLSKSIPNANCSLFMFACSTKLIHYNFYWNLYACRVWEDAMQIEILRMTNMHILTIRVHYKCGAHKLKIQS